jgi:hypothetical protein
MFNLSAAVGPLRAVLGIRKADNQFLGKGGSKICDTGRVIIFLSDFSMVNNQQVAVIVRP